MSKLFKQVQANIDFTRGKTARSTVRARRKAVEEQRVKDLQLMPDEEALQRSRRKKAAKRKGGRASTILTGDGDRLGP